MNDQFRAPKVVPINRGKPLTPEPFEADYGPVTDDMLKLIDEHCPQEQFKDAKVLKRFI